MNQITDTCGTRKGFLAVVAPEFKRIESEVIGGIARPVARVETVETPLVMCYNLDGVMLFPGDTVLLRGDAGAQKWAKNEFRLKDSTNFVLCPEDQVIGYRTRGR